MVEDITARVAAEAALRGREARYRAVAEGAAEGIFFFDAETKRITGANPAFLGLLGHSAAELRALTLYDLVAHDRASIDANTAAILATGHNAIGDRHYRRKDGALVTVEVSATARAADGYTDLCVIVRDVTAQRAATAALAVSEAQLRARAVQLRDVTDNVPVILFTLNALGLVTFATGSGLTALGLTPEGVIGRSIFASDRSPEVHGYVRRALDGEIFAATVPSGGRIFATHYAPTRDGDRISGVSGVAFDITERAQAEAELRRLNSGLSPRERELLPLLARKELTARQIGALLHIEPTTVRTYIEQIAGKVGVATTRRAVVEAARDLGLLIEAP